MDKYVLDAARTAAINELANEEFRRRVEEEKERLRRKRSFWQRVFGWLPFKIVRKNHVSD